MHAVDRDERRRGGNHLSRHYRDRREEGRPGAEMPGPDIDLRGEMKRSGLSAICMTFATDYQRGDAYDRFLKGLAVSGTSI